MSPVIQFMMLPMVGALIGWVTNLLAIRLLFRPRKPYRVPLIGYKLQGLIPKRHYELARDIGQLVENELLSLDDVFDQINTPEVRLRIANIASNEIIKRVKKNIPNFVPSSIIVLVEEATRTWLLKEFPAIFGQVISQVSGRMKEDIRVSHIVENKIYEFDLERLEVLIIGVTARELKHIEWLGAVLGFFIGLVQVGVWQIFS